MAEFLRSTNHILSKVEETITQAKEFVYLISPDFSNFPKPLFTKLWEALKRGAKIVLIYREVSANDEREIISLQHGRLNMFCSPNLNTNAFLNEKEAVLTSFSSFAPADQASIEFGIYFRKVYAADMYAQLLNEFKNIYTGATKMVIDGDKLVSHEELVARQPKLQIVQPSEEEVLLVASTKKLTVKEKQEVVLKLFAREYKDCTLKIEDAERLRIQGKGIVLVLSDERVDMIFVHYSVYQSRLEEIKQFFTARHPDLKAWFQYNRINMKLESEREIVSVSPTIREVVNSFNLV